MNIRSLLKNAKSVKLLLATAITTNTLIANYIIAHNKNKQRLLNINYQVNALEEELNANGIDTGSNIIPKIIKNIKDNTQFEFRSIGTCLGQIENKIIGTVAKVFGKHNKFDECAGVGINQVFMKNNKTNYKV